MARPKKLSNADRTTIKVGREAAERIRKIAFLERVTPLDLYTLALDEWVARYEAAVGKTLQQIQPGFAPLDSPEGQLLERIRKSAAATSK